MVRFRKIILEMMVTYRTGVGQDWKQKVCYSSGFYCCIFCVFYAQPQSLNCTNKVIYIYLFANSVVCFQHSSFLIHLIVFTLFSLLKLPSPLPPPTLTDRILFAREKYFFVLLGNGRQK